MKISLRLQMVAGIEQEVGVVAGEVLDPLPKLGIEGMEKVVARFWRIGIDTASMGLEDFRDELGVDCISEHFDELRVAGFIEHHILCIVEVGAE